MDERATDETGPLDAGRFSTWLDGFAAALDGTGDADVPCDGCTACCESRQFVLVAPDEVDTLAHIPAELLFPAPGMPPGHRVMGYDQRGRCPMLGRGGCTIYEHRPRTCRTYDCRVFAAAGVDADSDQVLLAERVRRWRFDHRSVDDRRLHDAVQSAASALAAEGFRSPRVTGLAVRAVEIVLRSTTARPERA
jgi:hypothetical protein